MLLIRRAQWTTAMLTAVLVMAGNAALLAAPQSERDLEAQLESGIHREVVLGDLKGALDIYRSILQDTAAPRLISAKALYQVGQCLEKSGRRTEAHNTYTQLVKDYRDQTEVAGQARIRLTDLEESIPGPLNLQFDQGVTGELPDAWFVSAFPKDANKWAQLRRSGCMDSGHCAVVLIPENAPARVGNLMQSFSAAAYRGKTVRLSAWIRVEAADPDDRAQMWLSVDRANDRKGFFDNMSERPLRSGEWTFCEIHGPVDPDATYIKFGVMSFGKGRVWVDRVSFELTSVAGPKVPGRP